MRPAMCGGGEGKVLRVLKEEEQGREMRKVE